MKKCFLYSLVCFLILLCSYSCKKKKSTDEYIPYVTVDFYIAVSNPQFISLSAVGGWVYVTGGSRGIVIYRKSNDEFVAFDRHCPYMPENVCGQIEVSASSTIAIDSCCGSQFLLIDGSVIKEPSSYPLLKYQSIFDGNQLHVFN